MFYKLIRIIGLPLFYLFYPHKIYGKENLPKDGNCVYVCNHYAKIDVAVVYELFKKRPNILGKKELTKNKFLGCILKKLGLIPIDRDGADINALKQCFSVLKTGGNLIIFPEGTRNKEGGAVREIKGGASMIAFKAKVKIVPIGMKSRFKMFKRGYAAIGKPFDFSDYYGKKLDAEVMRELDERIRVEIEDCRAAATELSEKK